MKDICAKWSHFTEQDVTALKGEADLVTRSPPNTASSRCKPRRTSTPQGPPVRRRELGSAQGASPARSPSGLVSIHGKSAGQKRDGPRMRVQARADPNISRLGRLSFAAWDRMRFAFAAPVA